MFIKKSSSNFGYFIFIACFHQNLSRKNYHFLSSFFSQLIEKKVKKNWRERLTDHEIDSSFQKAHLAMQIEGIKLIPHNSYGKVFHVSICNVTGPNLIKLLGAIFGT